ncbi:MAG TPA: MarC family protein [Burkholderiaceae bacterium]|nr:MarC family protein [Burkholderiaceae bacterium]
MDLHALLSPFVRTVVLVPVSLLPILNPIANAPIFVTMLGDADDRLIRRVSRLVATHCFVMIVAAILFGAHVLGFFGVSLPIVRVGGGLLVAASGWRMIGDRDADSVRPEFVATYGAGMSEEELRARSFYPISFPLTVGPGTLSASITIGTGAPARALDWIFSVTGAAVGAGLTAAAIFFCYRYAGKLIRALGTLGNVVLKRLSAFILLCIGVEIVWDGIEGLMMQASFLPHPAAG